MNIQKPTEAELQPLYIEATKNQRTDEWKKKLLDNIVGILRTQPLRYRIYGPYWWLLKTAFVEHEIMDFGTHIDREWFDALDYSDPAYNLIAAWAYEDGRFSSGQIITNPYHVMINRDGESFEFACNDEEMEALAVAQTMLNR